MTHALDIAQQPTTAATGAPESIDAPALSVIVVTPDVYDTVRRLIAHVRAQSALASIELVIVVPCLATLNPDQDELAAFRWVWFVEVGAVTSVAQARAAGIRRASAPVIVNTEDHCFPAPDWAAALIDAHRGPWVGVGPAFGNANPGVASWANLYVQYGPWVEPLAAGTRDDIPGHNGSYKRDLLLAYGEDLGAMLEAETMMHKDLRAAGHLLYLAPAARVDHINMNRPIAVVKENFWYGRLFAGVRAADWSWRRRIAYTVGAPLIPLVRLRRIIVEVRRSGRGRLLPAMAPALLGCLAASALGELIGYAAGQGHASARIGAMEFHRYRYITRRDRQALNV